ncbi:MAG: hypothetical protein EOP50_15630 [Sphingobacteriales bacterium]|nr:MAG: hypothetical protein EOP50_15630 [Sphingobacteriales bacterium]
MNQRNTLIAEHRFLAERLAALPSGAGLTRRSAEARLRQVDDLLARSDIHAIIVALPIKNQPDYIRKALSALQS